MSPFDGLSRLHEDRSQLMNAAREKELARRRAMRRWSDKVLGARSELEGVALSDEDDALVRTVHWLGMVLSAELIDLPRDALVSRTLRRIEAAQRPPASEGEMIAVAERLIRAHAERQGQLFDGASPELVAVFLRTALALGVASAFERVKPEQIVPLLARYTSSRIRPKGSLAASGILIELNKLARWLPVRSLTSSRIGNAVRLNR